MFTSSHIDCYFLKCLFWHCQFFKYAKIWYSDQMAWLGKYFNLRVFRFPNLYYFFKFFFMCYFYYCLPDKLLWTLICRRQELQTLKETNIPVLSILLRIVCIPCLYTVDDFCGVCGYFTNINHVIVQLYFVCIFISNSLIQRSYFVTRMTIY